MFNETKIKRLEKLLGIKDTKLLENALKRQAKYLKVSSTLLLNSYIIMIETKEEYENNRIKISKLKSKNIHIQKYKETILELFLDGFGYLKISKYLYLNHNVKISKSSIENFIKQNNIKRPDNG